MAKKWSKERRAKFAATVAKKKRVEAAAPAVEIPLDAIPPRSQARAAEMERGKLVGMTRDQVVLLTIECVLALAHGTR